MLRASTTDPSPASNSRIAPLRRSLQQSMTEADRECDQQELDIEEEEKEGIMLTVAIEYVNVVDFSRAF